jgi:hypothetical protein
MKKIIQGFRWDTDKADKVCDIREGYAAGDFRRINAALYCTKRAKRFFIAGEGGPMTMFAKNVDQNSWSGSSGIIPISNEDARGYAEKYADTDVIKKFFTVQDV